MDPTKVQAIANWPTPWNLWELRGFLGFANFYRRLIKDFAKLARPLNDLTKKDAQWTWNIGQKQAFQALKDTFLQKPILTVWEPNLPTRLEVDVSGYATGGVLLQKLEDNLWHPILFRSQSMVEADKTTKFMTRKCLPSSELSRTGVIIWKVFRSHSTLFPIIATSSIGAPHKTSLVDKPAGPFTLVGLTFT